MSSLQDFPWKELDLDQHLLLLGAPPIHTQRFSLPHTHFSGQHPPGQQTLINDPSHSPLPFRSVSE